MQVLSYTSHLQEYVIWSEAAMLLCCPLPKYCHKCFARMAAQCGQPQQHRKQQGSTRMCSDTSTLSTHFKRMCATGPAHLLHVPVHFHKCVLASASCLQLHTSEAQRCRLIMPHNQAEF
jgi:hypothetical protein